MRGSCLCLRAIDGFPSSNGLRLRVRVEGAEAFQAPHLLPLPTLRIQTRMTRMVVALLVGTILVGALIRASLNLNGMGWKNLNVSCLNPILPSTRLLKMRWTRLVMMLGP